MALPPPSSSLASRVSEIKNDPAALFGFEIEHVSPHKISGRLQVTPICCKLFKVLHGGVSALIAEGLASLGAYLANGRRRIAGIQLSISHLNSAQIGDLVLAEATPISVGKTIQMWEVMFWKTNSSNSKNRALIASLRVTIMCRVSENAKDGDVTLKLAKL